MPEIEEYEEIEERKDEINESICDLLDTLTYGSIEFYPEKLIEDISDKVCRYLWKEWGISVRYPRIENGDFVQFPYEPR